MAEGKEKFEIEDIKDPVEMDIDEVVSEEEPEKDSEIAPKEVEVESPEVAEEPSKVAPEEENSKKEETGENKDVLEKVVEETKEEKPKAGAAKKSSKKKWVKLAAIILLVLLVTAAAVMGLVYYLNQRNEPAKTDTEQPPVVQEEATPDEAPVESTELFINSEVGLNMRQEPNANAKVLAIIPFGTKISVLEEQTGWVKTAFEAKEGWVSTDFTQATDPLAYEDKTYGFGLTFKPSWAGYKFIESPNPENPSIKTYLVVLPTTDKSWKEPGVTAGYASLFVMGVYPKAEWAKIAGEEMKPAKLGESDKYVYTYLPGQAYAKDLKTQYYEVKDIIDSFEVLK